MTEYDRYHVRDKDQPSVITTGSGKIISLPCSATPPDIGQYVLEWKKEGDTVYTVYNTEVEGHPSMGYSGRLQHGDMRSLIINPVHLNDKGTYWCVIKSLNRPATHPIGRKVHLEVQVAPSFVNPPSSTIYKKLGDTLKLRCHAEGIPTPRTYWTKEERGPIVDNDHVTVEHDGSELNFRELKKDDEGRYRCQASNAEGSRSHDVQVLFAKGVYLEELLTNGTALAGNSYTWKCRAKAEPGDVQYEWYFGDLQVIYAGGLGLRSSTEEPGVLRISPVLKEDIGLFKCKALNGYGQSVETSGYLDVQYKPEILSSTPVIQRIPKGLPANLTCNVDTNPIVNYVKWTKNGTALATDGRRLSFISRHSVTFHFKQVTSDDNGAYTCQTYNTIGDSNIYEMHAVVQEPPYFKTVPVPVVRKYRNDDVTFPCAGGGDPKPSVIWIRANGKKVFTDNNRITTEGDKNLIIRNITPEDHGCYECVVNNTVATLAKQTCLYVENSVPQPPVNITVITGAFDARISWAPGYSGGRDQTFSFKYREKNSGSSWITFNVSTLNQFVITRLQPETEYEFFVEPSSELGPGLASSVFVAKTKGSEAIGNAPPTDALGVTYFPSIHRSFGTKPNPPMNFAVQSKYQTLMFVWDEPLPTAEPKVSTHYYSLEYKENLVSEREIGQSQTKRGSSNERKFDKLIDNISERKVQINGAARPLEPGHTYDFRVRAHSIAAVSDPSNTVTYTIPGVSSQMAIIAAVAGSLIFLLLCFVLFLIAWKCRKLKTRKKLAQNGKLAYANGHQNRASMLLDDNHGFTTASKKSDGSGFTDVPAQSRKSSLGLRLKSAAKKHLALSNKPERTTNWQYRHSQTSETLDSNNSTTNCSITTATNFGKTSAADALPMSASSNSVVAADGLINYLHDRAGGSLARAAGGARVDAVCNSINTLLKRFQSDTWQTDLPQQRQCEKSTASKSGRSAKAPGGDVAPLAVTPLGDAGYLFRLKTQYDRDQLLGTISALREQQHHHHHHHAIDNRNVGTTVIIGDDHDVTVVDYSPSVDTLAASFHQHDEAPTVVNNNRVMQISDSDDSGGHVMRVGKSVRHYENVYCSAAVVSASTGLQQRIDADDDVDELSTKKVTPKTSNTSPVTPSSSSSGIGSHESVGITNRHDGNNNSNPVSLMFREMYIMNSAAPIVEIREQQQQQRLSTSSISVVDTLDNDVRFQRLREEYRQSRRYGNKASSSRKDSVAESPVL